MARQRRLRGAGVIAAVLACATFGARATALSIDPASSTSVTIDGDAHYWNVIDAKTWNGYQYIAYWDAEDAVTGAVYVKVSRRRLSDNNVQSIRFDASRGNQFLERPNDGHNGLRLGLSPVDGRIHLSWSNHVPPNGELHHYGVSSAGCLSQANFGSCTFSFTDAGQPGGSAAQNRLTYPHYFNDGSQNLWFAYRCGEAARGNWFLHKYNNNNSWTNKGLIIEGRKVDSSVCSGTTGGGTFDVDGAGPAGASVERGIYPFGFAFDKNNRLHVLWTWREHITSWTGGFPVNWGSLWGQHSVYYAYSDDGGTTWKDNAGTTVGTTGSDPLHVQDVSLKVSSFLPPGSYHAPTDLALDSKNQPHIVAPVSTINSTDAGAVNYAQLHVWRTTDGAWYSRWLEPATNLASPSWGSLLFDHGDNLYVFYNRNALGWYPWNRNGYVMNELRYDKVTWQGGEYLDIQQQSVDTCIDSTERANIAIGPGTNSQIRVRIKNNTADTAFQINYSTAASPEFTVDKSKTFTITANDAGYKTYTFDMATGQPGWTGTLHHLELCPVSGPANPGDSVSFDYVRVTNSAGVVGKAWEFKEGVKVVLTEVGVRDNWSTAEGPVDLLPGFSNTLGDALFLVDDQLFADTSASVPDDGVVSIPVQGQGAPGIETITMREFDIGGDSVAKDWNFAVDRMDWTAPNHVSSFGWASDGGAGRIGGTITGNDSRILSPDNLKVPIGINHVLHVRMKNTFSGPVTGRVFFSTDADPVITQPKSKPFTVDPGTGYKWYVIDLAGVPGWSSNQVLRRIRIDPSDDLTPTTGTFAVDRVYLDSTL